MSASKTLNILVTDLKACHNSVHCRQLFFVHHCSTYPNPASLLVHVSRCTAGLVVECEIGFYNPNENANSQTACLPCPEQSTTLASAAFSIEQCICVVGYYAANATGGLTCSPCTMLTPRTCSLTHHPYRLPYLSFFWVQPVLSLSNHLRRVQCYQAQLERIA